MAKQFDIDIACVHDEASDTDRTRLLVDRVWPRGISKADLGHDDWIKDIAPTTELRKWFDHEPNKGGEFRNRYLQELADNAEAVDRCLAWCRAGPVTLLFAAKDPGCGSARLPAAAAQGEQVMTIEPGSLRTPLCDLPGCEYPVILAGMGGVARAELAAAVANAGGFPTLGMVREAPSLIASEIRAYRRLSDRPFAVHVIPAATEPGLLHQQIGTCLAMEVGVFSFFWNVLPEAIARVKAAGALLLHQVGTLRAAREAEAAGADGLISQGQDAGGHGHGRTPTFDLLRAVLDTTALPVVASGGIGTGKGLARALSLGAQGVQWATAFLATAESFAHDYHRQRIANARGEDTVLTDGFVLNWPDGSAVRVLPNRVTAVFGAELPGYDPVAIPQEIIAHDEDIPRLRHSTDSPLRTSRGNLEAMAVYAGQGVGEIRDILSRMVRQACRSLESLPDAGKFTGAAKWKA